MVIGNKKVAVVLMLHPEKILHRTKVITEVEISC
jgi:hypothetical protein